MTPSTSDTTTRPTSQTVRLNNVDLCVHTWKPTTTTTTTTSAIIKGIVVIYHGFLAHGLYPTVRYAAELLSNAGYVVVAADFQGHGQSTGVPGYLPGRSALIDDGVAIARYAKNLYRDDDDDNDDTTNNKKSLFLLGSSMGGTIALSVAQQLEPYEIAGVCLLAPMLQLSVSAPARSLLWALSYVAPYWQIIPSSSTNAEKQYRDAAKRKECEDDKLTVKGSTIRIGSASTCVELANCVEPEKVTTPFLLMVADEDVVVNNQGDFDLYEKAPATDKTMKRYPALHGLLCEPKPLIDEIQNDLLVWIQERS